MRFRSAILWALLLSLIGVPAHAEKRIALVIGNKDYKSGVGALANPLNDIRVVGDALKSVGFDVLKPVENATRNEMLSAIYGLASALKDAGPDAVGFLYYSGHGLASAGENYLVPIDLTEPSTLQLSIQGVRQSEVLEILRREAPNAAHYLVLDACRNTLQGAKGAKGFVSVGQQNGVLIAFSTEPGRTAQDTGTGSGPYAAALAAELTRPTTPGENDLNMFHNVRVGVIDRTKGDQVPWFEDGIQRRKRPVFAPPTSDANKPANAPPAVTTSSEAAQAWAAVKDTNRSGDLEAFIRRYGDGFYGDLARARLEESKKSQVAVVAPPATPSAPAVACGGVVSVSLSSRSPQPLSANEECALKPKDAFKECDKCPEMVVVPTGSFTMGSPNNEEGRSADEGPQHRVTFSQPFAAGRFPVTFDEWDACVADGGCNNYKPADEGWGRGRRPVINVSWDEAKAYVTWLSGKTGRTYRLLSESEREYVTRAGTTTRFWWGSSISTNEANYDFRFYAGATGEYRQKTLPVDSFHLNPWGLYQVHGNVYDWVEDCFHDTYNGASSNGSAWTAGDCKYRVLRGGAWNDYPRFLRAAFRGKNSTGFRNFSLGFRLARTLNP
jgi:formylglycine-generating enzyme required for sulfatase activity